MTKLKIEAPANDNYAATVVSLKDFVKLPNCDNIQAALIFGNHVIVGIDAKVGTIGLYFPAETQLTKEFLSANNLYRKPEHGNVDSRQKGFFEQHGRVKTVRFRGHKSEGFFIPLSSLEYTGVDLSYLEQYARTLEGNGGLSFDALGDHIICRKYLPKRNPASIHKQRGRVPRLEDSIVQGQFRFHPDTENLRRHIYKLKPTDFISISDKWHGTSAVIGNVLTVQPQGWYQRLLHFLGAPKNNVEYGMVHSSRRVIKGVKGNAKEGKHFYDSDIWGVVANEVKDRIPAGYTLYGEIVGFTPDGKAIQPGYHYGCPVGGHRFLVYRVTVINAEGFTLELSWYQMKEFCERQGLEMVKELWYGKAKHVLSKTVDWIPELGDWQEAVLRALEEKYVNDSPCPYNNHEVPAEGIVVRIDHLQQSEAYKLKNFSFLEQESKSLDKGEVDMETEESEPIAA